MLVEWFVGSCFLAAGLLTTFVGAQAIRKKQIEVYEEDSSKFDLYVGGKAVMIGIALLSFGAVLGAIGIGSLTGRL